LGEDHSIIFLVFWLMGLIVGIIATIVDPSLRTLQTVALNLLFYQITITVTLVGIMGFVGHVLKSDMVAESIGWSKGSFFQKELGLSRAEANY